MKKILICLLAALLFTVQPSAFAEEGEGIIRTRISVNTAAGTVTVNDEAVSCGSAPYITENGVTMIQMSLITDAFGAQEREDNGSVTVSYSGVEMSFYVNSADFSVGGQVIGMPERAVFSPDGYVMLPLRFFAESLGADVMYDSETGEIIISGSNEGIGTESSFELLLKYGSKSKVGSSKQLWRFNKPVDFEIEEGYYGDNYMFAAEEIAVNLQARKNRDGMTREQLYVELERRAVGGWGRSVLFERYEGERAGLPYVRFRTRATEEIVDYHGFLTDKFIYIFSVRIPLESFAEDKNNITIDAILDSFEAGYTGGDEETTVDLSKSVLSGDEAKTEYKDGNFGWELKLTEGWAVDEYYGYDNTVSVYRESRLNEDGGEQGYGGNLSYFGDFAESYDEEYIEDAEIRISIYSNPEKQSISDWAEKKAELARSRYNDKYLRLSEVSDTRVGEKSAKTFTQELTRGENARITKAYFIYDGYYRYEILFSFDERDKEDEGFIENAELVINSFAPAAPDYEVIGDILEPDDNIVTSGVTKRYDGELASFTLPYLWNVVERGNQIMVSDYSSFSSEVGVIIMRDYLDEYDEDGALHYNTPEQYTKKSFSEFLNALPRDVSVAAPVEKTELCGRAAFGYSLTNSADGELPSSMRMIVVPAEDNSVICITAYSSDIYKNTYISGILDELLASLELK